jgi:hypothetical protein
MQYLNEPKSCLNCPYRGKVEDEDYCKLVDGRGKIANLNGKPNWCPLSYDLK